MADEAELDYALLDGAGAAGSVFYPRPDPGPPPPGASDHSIEVEPGVSVAARFYVLGPSHPTVLYFHGNGEVVGDHDNFAPLYHEAGLNLFVAEFRGYGKSGGHPSMASLVADTRPVAAYFHDLLGERGFDDRRFIMGRSLGTQPALELASRDGDRFHGVIIESGAANIRRTLDRHGLAGSEKGERLAAGHEAKIRSIRLPALMLHGETDDLVPLDRAAELYDLLAGTQRELVVIPGAGHNDILWRGQRQYFEAIRSFVADVHGDEDDEGAALPEAHAPGAGDARGAATRPSERAASTGARSVRGLAELAAGVYVYTIPGVIPVNAGIVVGDDAVAVIDTGMTEADARALLEATASVTDLPVRYVINTHHHGDHSFGNWWFLPAIVFGHERCRLRLLGDEGASHRETLAQHLPMAAEQIRAVPLAPPALTFEGHCDLHLGPLSLRLAHLGLAHTDNDIAIGVEGAGVAFAGDLIEESGPPIVSEGYPAAWGPTLRRFEAAAVDRVVPGHGRVVDTAFVARQAGAFEALAATCAEAASPAEATDALSHAVLDVLGTQTPVAVRRYYETAGEGSPESGV